MAIFSSLFSLTRLVNSTEGVFLEFLAFDCVPSFSSGEAYEQTARGFSQRRDASEPEGNLDGFLAVCMVCSKTKARKK
jgi:hypothetical protein